MPYAATHILIPILIVALFRDFYLRKRSRDKFPLHYVLFAGLGGVLPDFDIIISIFLNLIGAADWNVHKTILHSVFLPIGLFILFLILKPVNYRARICNLTRHNLKLATIFLMISIGMAIHILLDYYFWSFVGIFPSELRVLVAPTLDGVLLVVWIVYLEWRHKISDFI